MRYAALDLPDLVLQLALRDRELGQDAVVAISAPSGGRDLVIAVSRAAREKGARPGQTVAQAKALAPELQAFAAAFDGAGETLASLAEALGTLSPAVELSPPEALLLDASAARFVAPAEKAEARAGLDHEQVWAEAVLAMARQFGLAGRVAVADTPLAARLLAASLAEPVRVIPAGRQLEAVSDIGWRLVEALVSTTAFQAPRMGVPVAGPPLWPPLENESFRLLEVLGIRRVGRLLELPAGTVLERLGRDGEALVAIAGGGRTRPLLAHRPPEHLVESVEFEPGIELASALVFALRPLMERLSARLSGRGVAVTKLLLQLETEVRDEDGAAGAGGADPGAGRAEAPREVRPALLPAPRRRRETVTLAFARPTTQARLMLDVVRDRLESWQGVAPILVARVEVAETGARRDQLALGERPRTVEGLESVLARLRGRLGEEALGSPSVIDDHLPERASRLVPFRPAPPAWRGRAEEATAAPEPLDDADPFEDAGAAPLRQWSPEEALAERDAAGGLRAFVWRGRRHPVLARTAPDRMSTDWWNGTVVRDYQTVLLADGARLWVFQDPNGRWWVQGVHD